MSQQSKHRNKAVARTNTLISFTPKGWEDFEYWAKTDMKVMDSIRDLLNECSRTPYTGTGKPEGLKGDLSGFWSRRITKEHRLVYFVEAGNITVIACRFHY
ncbi:Txe/YoeB family addiction module toxin [Pseudomonas fluorescens]|uniref:Putative mRNA interferase YoeB n=1 Tax=Pseudomonas fluorescens TaxID=294 RepID=A0A5E7Q078_PSEFL|nr:Txe/YoeB family addiction module toxin [Pseudomonas fluorescens]VVP54650.1 Toxin YoeB [Pseudomonas fluorescens]